MKCSVLLGFCSIALASLLNPSFALSGSKAEDSPRKTELDPDKNYYQETFSTTEFRDDVNTTAQWDTTTRYNGGEISIPPGNSTAVAQSRVIVSSERLITRSRIYTWQEGIVRWKLSADGGLHWQEITPVETRVENTWLTFDFPGYELLWQATMDDTVAVPTRCSRFVLEWRNPPLIWSISPGGLGDAPTIQAAVDSAAPGDTILLSDGVFSGPGNRDVMIGIDLAIQSEGGRERTIVDIDGGTHAFRYDEDPGFQSVAIVGLTIQNGSATGRAAVDCFAVFALIEDCHISGADAAILFDESPAVVRDCVLEDNICGITANMRSLEIYNTVVRRNENGISALDTDVYIENCTIADNTGRVILSSEDLEIVNSRIVDNGLGGSRWEAIWCDTGSLTITGNVIVGNSDGAIRSQWGNGTISDNVIAGNTGWVIFAEVGSVEVLNNTIVGNEAPGQALFVAEVADINLHDGILAFNSADELFAYYEASGSLTLANCDVFANDYGSSIPPIDGGGNFSEDPIFCDSGNADYMLRDDSPCLPENSPTGGLVGALGQGCAAPPVSTQFTDQAAHWDGQRVVLWWTVSEELTPSDFLVSRCAAGSATFEQLKTRILQRGTGFEAVDNEVVAGATYTYRVIIGEGTIEGVSVELRVHIPRAELQLAQNVPNPFNPTTTISFTLPNRMQATIAVFDVDGQLVRLLTDGQLARGPHRVVWDGCDNRGEPVSSGVYFYRLAANKTVLTRKMVLLK